MERKLTLRFLRAGIVGPMISPGRKRHKTPDWRIFCTQCKICLGEATLVMDPLEVPCIRRCM